MYYDTWYIAIKWLFLLPSNIIDTNLNQKLLPPSHWPWVNFQGEGARGIIFQPRLGHQKLSGRPCLQAKRVARRKVYEAKRRVENEKFGDLFKREDARKEIFRMARKMKGGQQDVVGETCIKDDDG